MIDKPTFFTEETRLLFKEGRGFPLPRAARLSGPEKVPEKVRPQGGKFWLDFSRAHG